MCERERKRKGGEEISKIFKIKWVASFTLKEIGGFYYTNGQSMYRNVLFLNYAQIAINTNVSETSKLGDISVFLAVIRIFR